MIWKHGSLFTGIGGFDLAAEWMGWDNIFHCEIDEENRRFLNSYWPKAISYADIKTVDFRIFRGKIDVLSGGFPCQPYSNSGLRKGTEDNRHLWPEYLRAIQEIRPRFVVGENVHGIVTWNQGLVFDEIHLDLENEGYEVWAFVLPACGVNAPHRRDRTWFIAHANGTDPKYAINGTDREAEKNVRWPQEGYVSTPLRNAGVVALPQGYDPSKMFENFPTEPPIYLPNDGLPDGMDGRWHKWAMKGLGNAVVPQVAYQIFKSLKETEIRQENAAT